LIISVKDSPDIQISDTVKQMTPWRGLCQLI
jgi:hypothetical protein